MKKNPKSFWKGESCTSERKWCGNHSSTHLQVSIGTDFFAAWLPYRFFSQLMIIRCHFHSLNGRHKWPQLYGSLSLLVLYMAWIFRMMPLLMLFIHEPKTLQIWISLRVCKCCPHIGLSHIGIQHIHASSPSSGKKSWTYLFVFLEKVAGLLQNQILMTWKIFVLNLLPFLAINQWFLPSKPLKRMFFVGKLKKYMFTRILYLTKNSLGRSAVN